MDAQPGAEGCGEGYFGAGEGVGCVEEGEEGEEGEGAEEEAGG